MSSHKRVQPFGELLDTPIRPKRSKSLSSIPTPSSLRITPPRTLPATTFHTELKSLRQSEDVLLNLFSRDELELHTNSVDIYGRWPYTNPLGIDDYGPDMDDMSDNGSGIDVMDKQQELEQQRQEGERYVAVNYCSICSAVQQKRLPRTQLKLPRIDKEPDERCRKIYDRCQNFFNKLLQNLETSNDKATAQRLLDEFGRFRVWAGNAGTHQNGGKSLDYHLKEASHIHAKLTELLEELSNSLQEGGFETAPNTDLNLYNTGFQALKLIEVGEDNYSPNSQVSLGEEFMGELGPLEDQGGPSEFEGLMSDISHIITCLNNFSTAIQNPAPKDCLHKISLVDISYFEILDIKHIDKMFCPVDPNDRFKVAKYLTERLGKANTKRRQLLIYYKAYLKKIPRYADHSTSSRVSMERYELTNTSIPTMEYENSRVLAKILDLKKAATVYTMTGSQTIEPASQKITIEQDEDQLSLSSFSTSTNHTMRIRVPSPPIDNAFRGKPFSCPYCFNIIKIRSRQDWKYVCNYARSIYGNGLLSTFVGGMYLGIFNPIYAHSSTAPRQTSYMAADLSGLIMRYSSTGKSGIVMPARSLFHKSHDFKSISK